MPRIEKEHQVFVKPEGFIDETGRTFLVTNYQECVDAGILHLNNDILMSLVDMFKLTYDDVITIVKKWTYQTYDIDAHRVFGANYI